MPTCVRRNFASSPSLRPVRSRPPTHTLPLVGRSSPATMLRSVDLPLPDGPITATNSPDATDMLIPSSAVWAAPPLYTLLTCVSSMTWVIGGSLLCCVRRAWTRRRRRLSTSDRLRYGESLPGRAGQDRPVPSAVPDARALRDP